MLFAKEWTHKSVKQNRESRTSTTFTWSTLSDKSTKVIQWKKDSLATHVARTIGCPYAKKKKKYEPYPTPPAVYIN